MPSNSEQALREPAQNPGEPSSSWLPGPVRRWLAGGGLTLPVWLFWGIFFGITWFYICRKLVEWDLWWHLAAGRFYVENGYYPPNNTFTFSPVQPGGTLEEAWLGDIVLYEVYRFSGYLGLQILAAALILCPVVVIYLLGDRRRNVWVLGACVASVLGTMQMHIVKNAIFAMFFLSAIAWLGVQRDTHKRWSLLLIAPLMWAWINMHGYAQGVGLAVITLMLAGDLVDLLCRRERGDWIRTGILAVVFFASALPLGDRGELPWASLLDKFASPVATWDADAAGSAVPKPAPGRGPETLYESTRRFVRLVFRGGDSELVAEYQYPIDIRYVLNARLLFAMVPISLLFFLTALIFYVLAVCKVSWAVPWAARLRMSQLLPAMATLHLGMGYLRTIAFPFLVALPWMVYGLSGMPWTWNHPVLKVGRRCLELVMLSLLVVLLFKSHRYYGSTAYDSALTSIGKVLKIEGIDRFKLEWPERFARLTGFIDTEVGYGKSLKFKENLPRYVLERYRDEKVLNSYNIGGYLIWEWYTDKKVYIDGRSAIYQPDFYKDYLSGARKYAEAYKVKLAMMSHYVDKDRIFFHLQENWSPVIFDNSMVLLKKAEPFDANYGQLPEFLCAPEELVGMDYVDMLGLGMFMRNTLNHYLIFGRIADALGFIEKYAFIVAKLDPSDRQDIESRLPFIHHLEQTFGRVNHPALGDLCRQLFHYSDKEHKQLAFAEALSRFGKSEQAAQEYFAYLQANGRAHEIWSKLALELFKLGRGDDAMKAMDQALSIAPGNANYLVNSGAFLQRMKRPEEAERRYAEALRSDPKEPMVYYNYGIFYQEQGKVEQAIAMLRKAVKLQPGLEDAQRRLRQLTSAANTTPTPGRAAP